MVKLKRPIRFTADILTTNKYELWFTPEFVAEYTGINKGIVNSYLNKIKNKNNNLRIYSKFFF